MNEDLLKVNLMYFLVSEVHTQLLKTVLVEHLEPIDIQQLQHLRFTFLNV